MRRRKWLAAIAIRKNDDDAILITKTNGSKVVTLDRRGTGEPIWSPDSRRILLNHDDGVYMIPREGGQERRFASTRPDRAVGSVA